MIVVLCLLNICRLYGFYTSNIHRLCVQTISVEYKLQSQNHFFSYTHTFYYTFFCQKVNICTKKLQSTS